MLLCLGISSCLSAAVYEQCLPVPYLLVAEQRVERTWCCFVRVSTAVYQQLFSCTLFARVPSGETRGRGAALYGYLQLFISDVFLYLVC
jgi:hypothetical protein